jgi:alpha-beta hydrolase superfamily lysophospholipase
VVQKLPPHDQVPDNRYFADSPVYPGKFSKDWNRSYELVPTGTPVGAVVLLHGLTDAPYSLRHIARHYRDRGFVAIGIRLPGHGTVPAGLTDAGWKDWMAATRLAMREAVRIVGPSKPIHIIGFSNGGALALKYALDCLDDPQLRRPDRLVLISPMVGITAFARFAGIAGWPAIFPAFVKTSWLSIFPEFNPFKYNSFPVNGAVQSYRLTRVVQAELTANARSGRLSELAPILTFQSVVDFTVSTRAVIRSLYGQLPDGGHELVLYDINRSARLGPLLNPASDTALARLLPPAPRGYRTSVISNVGPGSAEVAEYRIEAGATKESARNLGLYYPSDNYSLSHVALPFPPTDSLYGAHPDTSEDFGIQLGALAPRGEVSVLIVALDTLLRVSSNPFYSYMIERIDEVIDKSLAPS